MAEAMQGIMALSGAPEMGAQGAPELNVDPAQMAAFEQARSQIDPVEFGNEVLKAGEEVDPAELKRLRDTLKAANLPPEIVDAIGKVVDIVLDDPENYAEIRADFLAEGVPEELLPPEFDASFFAALNLALDQVNTSFAPDMSMEQEGLGSLPMGAVMPEQAPRAFAQGGIAQLNPIASGLAKMGRKGDTMLAHITPSEARMLRRNGGSGTINPQTGLREFWNPLKSVTKAVGKVFKGAAKAVVSGVKSVVKGVTNFVKTPVGRIVTAVALAYFTGGIAGGMLGAAASPGAVLAIQGFVGGFGSSMLAGDSLKKSLTTGAIAGVTAGVTAGITGGLEAFTPGSYTGPTSFGQSFDNLVSGTKDFFGAGATDSLTGGAEAFPVSSPNVTSSPLGAPPTVPTVPNITSPSLGASSAMAPMPNAPVAPVPTAPVSTVPVSMTPPPSVTTPSVPNTSPSFFDNVKEGASNLFSKLSPSTPSDEALNKIGMDAVSKLAPGTPEVARTAVYQAAVKEASPSFLRQYGPLVGAGLGIMGLSGGFTAPESEPPSLVSQETGFDYLAKDPERYGVSIPDAVTTYDTSSGYANQYATPLQRRMPTSYYNQPPAVRTFSEGGSTNVSDYPTDMDEYIPMDGPIDGPGTGTSDSIPAMLSDGEFVFTARAVRNAGGGSRRAGAKKMYALMKQLEEAN
jgi:hypothetical protein